jgi:hypothetical protein
LTALTVYTNLALDLNVTPTGVVGTPTPPFNITFQLHQGLIQSDSFNNFFFCWATGSLEPITDFICDTYSNGFVMDFEKGAGLGDFGNGAFLAPTTTLPVYQSTGIYSILGSPTTFVGPPTASTTHSSPTGSTPTTTPTTNTSAGLSTGSKIGIGIAIPLIAVIILAASSIWYIRRRHYNTKASSDTERLGGFKSLFSIFEKDEDKKVLTELEVPAPEADGNPIHESDNSAQKPRYELSDGAATASHELSASPAQGHAAASSLMKTKKKPVSLGGV